MMPTDTKTLSLLDIDALQRLPPVEWIKDVSISHNGRILIHFRNGRELVLLVNQLTGRFEVYSIRMLATGASVGTDPFDTITEALDHLTMLATLETGARFLPMEGRV